MLHWNDKILPRCLPNCPLARRKVGWLLLALLGALTPGCGPKTDTPPAPAALPSPRPSQASGPPIAAAVQGIQATLFNGKGEIVAKIAAQAGAVGTRSDKGMVRPEGLGTLKGGEAVLYQNGKPAAVMKADTMTADRAARTVVGTGNVRVRSLQKEGQNAPTIRADTMTWRHDSNLIRGKGNVRITSGPDVEVPGENFDSDTLLQTFRVWNGAEPKRASIGNFQFL